MENLSFDISSNLLDLDSSISNEDYITQISNHLKIILQQTFKNDYLKQEIVFHKDRISMACPICGDSMHSSRKKRGNIILVGDHANYYKCFNCGAFHKVDKFFERFKIDLDLNVINYIENNKGQFNNKLYTTSKYDISLLLDINNVNKYTIERQLLKDKLNLIEVKNSSIWNWLTKRLQFKEEKFLYNQKENYLLILNLTNDGKILGAQKRLFYGDNKYLTYGSSKLHEILKLEKVPDEIDSLSQLFNIFQINFNLPVTAFEGPMDSFLFKNSIANCGVNKKIPFDLPLRFFLDDDKTGREKSIKLLNEGNQVFLWEKLKKELNLPIRKKWDLNDLMIYLKNNNMNVPLFDNYFSNDPFDLIDL